MVDSGTETPRWRQPARLRLRQPPPTPASASASAAEPQVSAGSSVTSALTQPAPAGVGAAAGGGGAPSRGASRQFPAPGVAYPWSELNPAPLPPHVRQRGTDRTDRESTEQTNHNRPGSDGTDRGGTARRGGGTGQSGSSAARIVPGSALLRASSSSTPAAAGGPPTPGAPPPRTGASIQGAVAFVPPQLPPLDGGVSPGRSRSPSPSPSPPSPSTQSQPSAPAPPVIVAGQPPPRGQRNRGRQPRTNAAERAAAPKDKSGRCPACRGKTYPDICRHVRDAHDRGTRLTDRHLLELGYVRCGHPGCRLAPPRLA
jgi:hypothetical protein